MTDRRRELEQEQWFQAKSAGRIRFVLRRGILPTLLIWLVVLAGINLFEHKSPFSRGAIAIDFMVLPIVLLGGYLKGRWKWNELAESTRNSLYPDLLSC